MTLGPYDCGKCGGKTDSDFGPWAGVCNACLLQESGQKGHDAAVREFRLAGFEVEQVVRYFDPAAQVCGGERPEDPCFSPTCGWCFLNR